MPLRRCPFCPYEWSRPEKIKAHLTDAHHNILSPENLQGICDLRGQKVVVFLDSFESIRNTEFVQIPASPTFLSPASS